MNNTESTPVKTGLARFRNSKGFSLIEMAIVLVIIGIIVAAIIKGQDLIINSRAKQVISAVSTWRNLTTAFMDRNGRLPGDGGDKNGIIGDQAAVEQVEATTAIGELATLMPTAPPNPVVVGSSSFYVYFGSIDLVASGVRNAMIICGDSACANVFTSDQLEIIKSLDTAIDGAADAGIGQVRAVTTAPKLVKAVPLLADAVNGRWAASFSGVVASGVTPIFTTQNGTTTDWALTHRAAIWSFDKPW